MYDSGNGAGNVLGSSTIVGSGAVILPNTAGNTVGQILAYSAIAIGVTALVSQLAVILVRRYNRG